MADHEKKDEGVLGFISKNQYWFIGGGFGIMLIIVIILMLTCGGGKSSGMEFSEFQI